MIRRRPAGAAVGLLLVTIAASAANKTDSGTFSGTSTSEARMTLNGGTGKFVKIRGEGTYEFVQQWPNGRFFSRWQGSWQRE